MLYTFDFSWYAGAPTDFVWQAGSSILVDVYEDTATPADDVLFRFRSVIDNGYDVGGIVNVFFDTGSPDAQGRPIVRNIRLASASAGVIYAVPGDMDAAQPDSAPMQFMNFASVAMTPDFSAGRITTVPTYGVNPGEFLTLRADLRDGAQFNDLLDALNLGSTQHYSAAPSLGQMSADERTAYLAAAPVGLRLALLYHQVVPNPVNPDGHGMFVTGSLASVSALPGDGPDDGVWVGTGGNDMIDGGVGADYMSGLAGDDTYIVDNFDDRVVEGAVQGTDTIVSYVSIRMPDNVEDLVLRAISAEGNDLDNVIVASNGNNYIDGHGGVDTLSYQDAPAPVKVSLTLTSRQPTGGSGDDIVFNFENLTGSSFGDTLTGNGGANVIDGGQGADTISGLAGNDTYIVDNPGDVITNDTGGMDTVLSSVDWTLGSGLEHLVLAGSAPLTGTGNTLVNRLTGNGGDNHLNGLSGDDTLDGGTGADAMAGGSGNDSYVVDSAGDIVVENAGEGTDTVSASLSYTLPANVEKLVLLGTTSLDGTGNALNNTLTGNSAANSLYGLAGNDTLDGGAGADNLVGGAGNDTYVVDAAGDNMIELSGEGTDTVRSAVDWVLGANIENLTLTGTVALQATGNGLANALTGNGAANLLTGLAGNDTLDGGVGADTMVGGAGNDVYYVDSSGDLVVEQLGEGTDLVNSTIGYVLGANVEKLTLRGTSGIAGTGNELANTLTGNTAGNALDGGAGNDLLIGGAGADTLTGGLGADTFDFNATSETPVGIGRDLITDFNHAQGDRIDLSSLDANTQLTGNQAFAFIGAAPLSGVAGQLHVVADGIPGGWLVQGDVNGDTVADFEVGVILVGASSFVATDFLL